jgi:hypothetical protein
MHLENDFFGVADLVYKKYPHLGTPGSMITQGIDPLAICFNWSSLSHRKRTDGEQLIINYN